MSEDKKGTPKDPTPPKTFIDKIKTKDFKSGWMTINEARLRHGLETKGRPNG